MARLGMTWLAASSTPSDGRSALRRYSAAWISGVRSRANTARSSRCVGRDACSRTRCTSVAPLSERGEVTSGASKATQ